MMVSGERARPSSAAERFTMSFVIRRMGSMLVGIAGAGLLAGCANEAFTAPGGAGGSGGEGGAGGATSGVVASSSSAASTSTTAAATSSSSTGAAATSFTVVAVDQHDAAMANVPVVAHDDHGVPGNAAHTNVSGTVTIEVPGGGSVSVFLDPADPTATAEWVTVQSPPDGATLRVRGTSTEPPAPFAPTTYKVVAQGAPANSSFRFWSHCDLSGPSSAISAILTNAECTELPAESFVVGAYDASDTLVAWGTAGAPTSPGALFDLVVILSQTTFDEVAVQSGDLPAGTLLAQATWTGLDSPSDQASRGGAVVAPSFSASLRVANLPVDRRLVVTALLDPASYLIYEEVQQAFPPTLWLTASATQRPTGLTAVWDNIARPTMSWATTGGDDGQMAQTSLSWSTGGAPFRWTAFVPLDGTTTVTLPLAPIDQTPFIPSANTTFTAASVKIRDRAGEDYASLLDEPLLAVGDRAFDAVHYLDLSP